jgi:hypothetical protein
VSWLRFTVDAVSGNTFKHRPRGAAGLQQRRGHAR